MTAQCFKKARLSLLVTVLAAALSSFSLTFIPFTSGIEAGENNIVAYIIASVFWMGLIVLFISTFVTKKILYKYREDLIHKNSINKQRLPGILSFSLNWQNMVLYAVTVLGLILIVTDIILSYVPEMVMFPVLSVTIFSFMLHCVIDGKYYKTYKLIKGDCKQ